MRCMFALSMRKGLVAQPEDISGIQIETAARKLTRATQRSERCVPVVNHDAVSFARTQAPVQSAGRIAFRICGEPR